MEIKSSKDLIYTGSGWLTSCIPYRKNRFGTR